jgi:hypothetical protein
MDIYTLLFDFFYIHNLAFLFNYFDYLENYYRSIRFIQNGYSHDLRLLVQKYDFQGSVKASFQAVKYPFPIFVEANYQGFAFPILEMMP